MRATSSLRSSLGCPRAVRTRGGRILSVRRRVRTRPGLLPLGFTCSCLSRGWTTRRPAWRLCKDWNALVPDHRSSAAARAIPTRGGVLCSAPVLCRARLHTKTQTQKGKGWWLKQHTRGAVALTNASQAPSRACPALLFATAPKSAVSVRLWLTRPQTGRVQEEYALPLEVLAALGHGLSYTFQPESGTSRGEVPGDEYPGP